MKSSLVTLEIPVRTYVKVGVGTDGETLLEYLCVDLIVNGQGFSLFTSDVPLNELGAEEFDDVLSRGLNIASLLKAHIEIPVVIAVGDIVPYLEEFGPEKSRSMKKLLGISEERDDE